MPDPATVTAATVVAPAVTKTLESVGPKLFSAVGKITQQAADEIAVNLRIGFGEYLNKVYNKCRYFKTILDMAQPLEVKDKYVHVTLTKREGKLADDDVIDNLRVLRRVVITGLAGSGKSMFMKYLTLRKFAELGGQIPLFVDLRNINSITDKDLLTYIRLSCTSRASKINQRQFDLSLRAGILVLILDGFDELNYDIRDDVQSQILSVEKEFPAAQIIVSSRPDPRFGGWASFHVYEVDQLSDDQAMELIESLEYDAGVKRRFIKEVKSRLMLSHKSFLSSPLLLTIMLLTYEGFAEIPGKMHSFYGQAFDTLLQKHDAQKEQYKRKTYTGLDREDFKRCFSAFCAISYLEEKFSFDDEELNAAATGAVKFLKQTSPSAPKSLTADQLISDLKESVCMLQPDGLDYAFVHRSFQEYFAALFITHLSGPKVREVADRYARRFGDTTLSMAIDISRALVEREWVLPTIDQIESVLIFEDNRVSDYARYGMLIPVIGVRSDDDDIVVNIWRFSPDVFSPVEALFRLYNRSGVSHDIEPFFSIPISEMKASIASTPDSAQDIRLLRAVCNYDEIPKELLEDALIPGRPSLQINDAAAWWMRTLPIKEKVANVRNGLASIKKEVSGRVSKRDSLIDSFLE